MSDLESAIDRIQHAVAREKDRRVAFVTGSGLSLGSVPSTRDMIQFFLDEFAKVPADLQNLSQLSNQDAYLKAAHALRQRRGDRGLAKAIQTAVLGAHLEPEPNLEQGSAELLNPARWTIPSAQDSLAHLIRLIPSHRRGPVFTTNFDPLTEVAARRYGVDVAPVATDSLKAFNLESIVGPVPIVHLHGYWLQSSTLSTSEQLSLERPDIENLIKLHLANSLVVVVGYGGWEDAFTRALKDYLVSGRLGALQAEILWMCHGSANESGFAASLRGNAGFNLYEDIDATALLAGCTEILGHEYADNRTSYPGWQAVPRQHELQAATTQGLNSFVSGAQPTWRDANTLQPLSAAHNAVRVVQNHLSENATEAANVFVSISGPTGEGKSLAIMQAALEIATKFENVTCLYREPVAPNIQSDWLKRVRSQSKTTLIVVDEADLILRDLPTSLRQGDPNDGSTIIWLLAVHSHYADALNDVAQETRSRHDSIPMHTLSYGDASIVAANWKDLQLLPSKALSWTTQELTDILRAESEGTEGDSLFGAVLHLWMSDSLIGRVEDLLDRMQRAEINGATYFDILVSIALVQDCWDPDVTGSRGITLGALAELSGIDYDDVVPYILAPLGREAGIAKVGARVYVRHGSIAKTILSCLSDQELQQAARRTAEVGGRIRGEGRRPSFDSREMYMLSTHLEGSLAMMAAQGAVEGAGWLLEARVTMLSIARKNDRIELASKYAIGIERDLPRYVDRQGSERGYWVERAWISIKLGEVADAASCAIYALTDLDGARMDLQRITYALVAAATALERAQLQSRSFNGAYDAAIEILQLIPNSERYYKPPRPRPPQENDPSILDKVRQLQHATLFLRERRKPQYNWTFKSLPTVLLQANHAN